ncbi:MAG: hypothetical protein II865_08235 [Bacteroidales bacterium]|nr:hypothetical protein [Bacteroidales bacterium]
MKRATLISAKRLAVVALSLSLSLLILGCQTTTEQNTNSKNRLIPLPSYDKVGSSYLMLSEVGHDGAKCPGCVLEGGQLIHVDCQGDGHSCTLSSNVNLFTVGGTIIAMTTDTFGLTSEDFFYMPARSLSTPTIGPEHYLNIPAQVVYRDSAKQQFTFTGLFYSETPAYNNF